MRIEDLERVRGLIDDLQEAKYQHKKYSDSLAIGRCSVIITGYASSNSKYCHGSNRLGEASEELENSIAGKELLAKLRDEAWGEVVRIRAELRGLGVEL